VINELHDHQARIDARRAARAKRPHYVYRCYDAEGHLVYVGCTSQLFKRLDYHRRYSVWASQITNVTAKVYPNQRLALAKERMAIVEENPLYNVAGKSAPKARAS
jgi:excinuclease UvrABC nuclease subunit